MRNPARRIAAAILPTVLVGAAALLWAPAAAAHDDLVGSDPAAGSTVAVLPDQVTLTFSGAVLAEPGTAVVAVVDATGSPLQTGEPVVAGPVVTQPLAGAVSGPMSVQWRVVSADGHPISGAFGFVVAAPTSSPSSSTTAPAPSTTAPSPAAAGSTAGDESAAAVEGDAGGVPLYAWLLAGAAVLLAIAIVVWLLVARSRQQHQTVRDRTAGRTDTSDR